MILTCPSCSASYMVPSEAIGERGRDVRCKKCGHVWFQKSEKDSLSELIDRIQSSDIDEDDISFGDSSSLPKPPKSRHKEGPTVFVRLSRVVQGKIKAGGSVLRVKLLVKLAPVLPYIEKLKGKEKIFAGGMVALALMSVVILLLTTGRFVLVDFVPALRSVYVSAGFPLVSYDPLLSPEDSLIIERAQFIRGEGGKGGEISANLINLTGSEVFLPELVIRMVDSHGQVLKEENKKLPYDSVPKETSVPILIEVSEEVAKKLATVDIRFHE